MLRRLRALFGRRAADADLDEEIRHHIELETEKNIREGLPPAEARRMAHVTFGGVSQVVEEHRDVRGLPWIEHLTRDVRYALRTLARSPGYTIFSLLTFAVAIGGLSVIFTLVNAVVLQPLPYPDAHRLVMVLEADGDEATGGHTVAAPNFTDWRAQNTVFERMALYEYLGYNITDGDEPEQVGGLRVTGGVFDVLRVAPMLGRGLMPADDSGGNGRVVVLSHRLWQRRYGSDSSIVGRSIAINRIPHQVVGVMPAGFGFPSTHQQLWVPIMLNAEDASRGSHSFWSIARLKDGVSLEQAFTEMRAMGTRLAQAYPETNTGETVNVFPMRDLWTGDTREVLRNLMIAVVLVLLIAAANIASLQVARGNARRRELASRMALGGSRGRIVRQLVTESAVLATGGALLGLAIAIFGIRALITLFPPGLLNVPFRDLSTVTLDPFVVGVAVAVALLAGALSGWLPALSLVPAEPASLLREGGGKGATMRGARLRSGLVGIEVALAVVVLAGAGLLVASMARLQRVAPGLDTRNVLVMGMELPQADFYGPAERIGYCADVRREVAALPGVTSMSVVSHLPLSGANAGRGFVVEGAPDPGPENQPGAQYGVVCPGYFTTMGIPLVTGRDFNDGDRADVPPVAVINQQLQQRYFPDGSPVGRRIKLGRFDSPAPWVTIIGVVGDVRHEGLQNATRPYLYMMYQQAAWPGMQVMVKTEGDPATMARPVAQALRRAVPGEPIEEPITMDEIRERSLGHLKFPVVLFAAFAGVAAGLAALGCFGVASQMVAQRRRELAVRMALGARAAQVSRMVVRQAMKPVLWGIAAGIGGAILATKALRGMLYGIEPGDPGTLALGAALLAAATGLACFIPARRAARVDPAEILRGD